MRYEEQYYKEIHENSNIGAFNALCLMLIRLITKSFRKHFICKLRSLFVQIFSFVQSEI